MKSTDGHPRVLIVEDTEEMAQMVADYLSNHDFHTQIVGDVYQARDAISAVNYEVIVLDWMLPGPPGLDLLADLPTALDQRPGVILLTALAEESRVVEGLEAGADDYVTKPFSLAELCARVKRLAQRRAAFRRDASSTSRATHFSLGRARFDTTTGEVLVDNQPFVLGEISFRLLVFFYHHQKQVHSRSKLMKAAWPTPTQVADRTVDVHIHHLRKFLKQQCGVGVLRAVRQAGYRFFVP